MNDCDDMFQVIKKCFKNLKKNHYIKKGCPNEDDFKACFDMHQLY